MAEIRYRSGDRAFSPSARDVRGLSRFGPTLLKQFGSARSAIIARYDAQRCALIEQFGGRSEVPPEHLARVDRDQAEALADLEARMRRRAEEEVLERRRDAEERAKRRAREDFEERMNDPRHDETRRTIERYRAIERRRQGRRQGLAPPFDFWADDTPDTPGGGRATRSEIDRLIGDDASYDPQSDRGARIRRRVERWFRSGGR